MRLHTSILTASDVYAATRAAGMCGVSAEVTTHGSRAHARGLEIKLTGTSSRRPNSGNRGAGYDDYAATWDEWGMVLAALYDLDPDMVCGSPGRPVYASAAAFHAATCNRFGALTAPYQHDAGGHHWERAGNARAQCSMCSAEIDYMFTGAASTVIVERLAASLASMKFS